MIKNKTWYHVNILKYISHMSNSRRGAWNLPHKFQLYLILFKKQNELKHLFLFNVAQHKTIELNNFFKKI